MTKPRPPISLDAALTRIAGQFEGGFTDLGKVLDRDPSLIRRWGDDEQREQFPMWAAIQLDIAYQRAGGEGAPVFETYALLLQVSQEEAFADQIHLQRQTANLARESAQAVEWGILASLPDASQAVRDRAAAELEDVDRLIPKMVAILKRPPVPDTS